MMAQRKKVLLVTSLSLGGNFLHAPPLGLFRLQGFLKKNDVDAVVFDVNAEPKEDYLDRVAQGEFDVIGFSVAHINMIRDLDLLCSFHREAQKAPKKIYFVAGGQAATLNFQQYLEAGFEAIFLGFAEKSLLAFLTKLAEEDGKDIPLSELCHGIDGVAYLNEKHDLVSRLCPVLTEEDFIKTNYDDVLEMDVPFELYWEKIGQLSRNIDFQNNRFIIKNVRILTSSPCIKRCGFCSSQSFIKAAQGSLGPQMMLSAQQVFHLVMHHIEKYGAEGVLFSDDEFLLGGAKGIRRAKEFCRLVIDAKQSGKMPQEFPFNCQARVTDFLTQKDKTKKVDRELIHLTKEAGFNVFGIGVETFTERLLHVPSMNKVGVTVEYSHAVLETLLSVGMIPQINLILLVPETTIDEMIETMMTAVDYMKRHCSLAVTPLMNSWPGAPIFGRREYDIRYREYYHPLTQKAMKIADYYIPHDPELRKIADHIEPFRDKELARIKKDTPIEKSMDAKHFFGLVTLYSIVTLLKRKKERSYFEKLIHEFFPVAPSAK